MIGSPHVHRLVSAALLTVTTACGPSSPGDAPASPTPTEEPSKPVAEPGALPVRNAAFQAAVAERVDERNAMVEQQLVARELDDPRVLAVFRRLPRHAFVPEALQAAAYEDRPLPLGYEATITQPYIVALMTKLADVQPGERVLDVGTGSGYQAAALAELGVRVHAIEIVPELVESTKERFARLGFDEIDLVQGDGWKGRPEHAPYDAIVVAAAPYQVPQPLLDQLADGGVMVIPTGGDWAQLLRVITKKGDRIEDRKVAPVAFVPLVHGAERPAP